MQLSISTYSLSRWRKEQHKTLEQAIDWIAATGVPGVEFTTAGWADVLGEPRTAKALAKRCKSRGIKPVSYCVAAELFRDPKNRPAVIEQLKREVDFAADLGVPSMRHDVTRGPAEGQRATLSQILKTVVPAIREITEYAQSLGVKTSLENHGFYLQPADVVEKLIRAVDHPNFGLTMDMGNFLCVNQDPVAAVKKLAKYAIMVHAKDFHLRPKKTMPASGWFATPAPIALRGAICGHGVVDIPAQLKALKQAKYNGFLSLEFEGMEDPTQGVTLGLEFLRAQLKRL